MKKLFMLVMVLVIGGLLIGCTPSEENNEIKVAVSFYPMNAILDLIKDDVKEDGYELSYQEYTGDHISPNNALNNKEFDANMMQHEYFMDSFNRGNNGNLVLGMRMYHATFALYSTDNTTPENIPANSEVAIPNDPDNVGRALLLLRDAGLIELTDDTILIPKESDIKSNPKNLKFVQLGLAAIQGSYGKDIKFAVNYPTYMKSLNIEGNDQRVFVEDTSLDRVQKFAISLVVREDNKDSEKIQVLKKHLNSDKVRNLLINEYGWASKPAF